MNYAFETEGVSRRFGDVRALEGLSLRVEEGICFGLLGTNGAGKTTAVKLLTGLLRPDEGRITLLGHPMPEERDAVRPALALSPQENAVAPHLTVRENIALFLDIYGNSGTRVSRNGKIDAALANCGLTEVAARRAGTLSGGWQRRLSIAMALSTSPRLLFLDEPTLGLDIFARRELWGLIEGLRGKTTVLLTTHYLEEAERLCDRVAILARGHLCAEGTPEELIAAAGGRTLEDAFVRFAGEEGTV